MAQWKIAAAKENLSEVLRKAETEPQEILNRDRLVAAVIDADSYRAFAEWRRAQHSSIADAFAELRQSSDGYVLKTAPRRNRRHELSFGRPARSSR